MALWLYFLSYKIISLYIFLSTYVKGRVNWKLKIKSGPPLTPAPASMEVAGQCSCSDKPYKCAGKATAPSRNLFKIPFRKIGCGQDLTFHVAPRVCFALWPHHYRQELIIIEEQKDIVLTCFSIKTIFLRFIKSKMSEWVSEWSGGFF